VLKSWRIWHRRISVFAALFLLVLGVSGAVLQFQQLKYRYSYPQEAPTGPPAEKRAHEIPEEAFEKLPALKIKIDQVFPGAVIERVVLLLRGESPTWSVYAQNSGETRLLRFDPRSLELLGNEKFAYDSFWLSLHTGQSFGDAGIIVNFLIALVFLLVTLSGVALFFRG